MREAVLIFPHQLFLNHPALKKVRPVFLIEEQLLYGDWRYPARFHQQKLVFHRASLKSFAAQLRKKHRTVFYIDHQPDPHMAYLFDPLVEKRIERMVLADPVDHMLTKRLRREAKSHAIEIEMLPSPAFLTPPEVWSDWLSGKDHFTMARFYRLQRERLNILIENGKPSGGRWSFDEENRKPWSGKISPPRVSFPARNRHVREAMRQIRDSYPDNPGSIDHFRWPVTHTQAEAFLQDFLENRFHYFGDYEDAIAREEPFLFHSLLSPLLNVGLLSPKQVIDAALAKAKAAGFELNQVEGFVRQIIGWREFMRAIYELDGVRQRTTNFWGFTRHMPNAFYHGNTGIDPVDRIIHRVLENAYAHHIERLMVLGSFMLLCEIHPDAVYQWFMELFIDAYDWVMTPNVYGMSQYADGGRMVSKPYLCGSNYICRMSDFTKGPWCDIWDGLFWRFVDKHRDTFTKNYRLSLLVSQYDRMKPDRRKTLLNLAKNYLRNLDEKL